MLKKLLPPTFVTDKLPAGHRAINYFWGIKIHPDEGTPTYAQEVFEWRIRFGVFLVSAILIGIVFPYTIPLAGLVPNLTRIGPVERWMEMRGHTITAILTPNRDVNELLFAYAGRLKNRYNGFDELSQYQVAARMHNLVPQMTKWTKSWPWKRIIQL